jgi:hypothetical protein
VILTDYLAQLRKLADSALEKLQEREQTGDGHVSTIKGSSSWWDGYRQALDDVTEFVNTHEEATP